MSQAEALANLVRLTAKTKFDRDLDLEYTQKIGTSLSEIRYTNGELVFELPKYATFTYQMLYQAASDFDKFVELLKSNQWKSRHEIWNKLPLLEIATSNNKRRAELYLLREQKLEGAYPCRKCKSGNTSYSEGTTRSLDEAATIFAVCHSCSYQWRE